jgi:type I restriction enzyme S subunit
VSGRWPLRVLGDVSEVQSGGTPARSRPEFWNGDIAWYSSGELNEAHTSAPERMISKAGLENSNAKLFRQGSLLIGMYDTAALKMSLLGRDATFNQAIAGVAPNDKIDLKFVFHAINALKTELLEQRRGVRQKNLSLGKIKAIQIPLPQLSEQQRIVAILDEAFAGLSTATANVEKNLKNARELFESYLNSVFTNPEGWVQSPIGELATKIGSGATPTGGEKSYKKQGVPLIRSLNVHDRRFKTDHLAFLDDAQAKKLEGVTVQSGDVLLNITGASVARCCLAPDAFLPARVNQHVSIIRPIQSTILPRFLEFGLTAKTNKDRLLGVGESAGATRQAITKAQIQEFEFSYPPLGVQQAIIEQLNGVGAETGKLEAHYADKLKSLVELKQSTLRMAFSSELTSSPMQAIKEAAE